MQIWSSSFYLFIFALYSKFLFFNNGNFDLVEIWLKIFKKYGRVEEIYLKFETIVKNLIKFKKIIRNILKSIYVFNIQVKNIENAIQKYKSRIFYIIKYFCKNMTKCEKLNV